MSLDAFANSMDQMMSTPSGVSNSSLSMRTNTDYDMDDFTGRHDHRMGGSIELANQYMNKWNFYAILILYMLSSIHVATGTGHNPAKGYAFLIILGIFVLIPVLYQSLMTITGTFLWPLLLLTTLLLVSSVQLRIPHPGLTVMNISFVIILFFLTSSLSPIVSAKGILNGYNLGNATTFSIYFRIVIWLTAIWCALGVFLPNKTWITVLVSIGSLLTFGALMWSLLLP